MGMSFDAPSALQDNFLQSPSIPNDPNEVFAGYTSIPKSNNASENYHFTEEYYIALAERGYWKAQHKKARERIEELECENKELKAKLRMR